MRKLYEIRQDIEDCILNGTDPETGEFLDVEQLDKLMMEESTKIENVALYAKNCRAEAEMISNEISALIKRQTRLERAADGAHEWIAHVLNGQNFETPKVECVFRKSVVVEVDDNFCEWAYTQADDVSELVSHIVMDKPKKQAIKMYLKNGGTLEHCRLVERKNMAIK